MPHVETISGMRSEEHTSELQSRLHLVCRLLLEKKTSPQSGIVEQPPRAPSASGDPSSPVAPPTSMPPLSWYPAAAGRPPNIGRIVVAIVVILDAFLVIAFSLVGFPSPFLFSAAPFF